MYSGKGNKNKIQLLLSAFWHPPGFWKMALTH